MANVTSAEKFGIEKGMEKGIEKGMEKGMEMGIEKGRYIVAKSLWLKGADINFIAQVTELPLDAIKKIQEEVIFSNAPNSLPTHPLKENISG